MRDTNGTAPLATMEAPTSTGRRNTSWRWLEAAQRPGALDAVPDAHRRRARAVLVALASHADERGACWPSLATIGQASSLAPKTVSRALGDLEDAGLITRRRDNRPDGTLTSYRYRLTIPTDRPERVSPGQSQRTPADTSQRTPADTRPRVSEARKSETGSHTPLRGQIAPGDTVSPGPEDTVSAGDRGHEPPETAYSVSHTPLRGQIAPGDTSAQPGDTVSAQELPKNLNPYPPLETPPTRSAEPEPRPVEGEDGRARVSRSEQAQRGAALDAAIRSRLPGHLARSIPRTHAKLRAATAEATYRAEDAGVSVERVAAHVVGGLGDAKDPGALLAYRLTQLDPATLREVARHEAGTRDARAANVEVLVRTYAAEGVPLTADLAREARALGLDVAEPEPVREPRWTSCPPEVRRDIRASLGKLDARAREVTPTADPSPLADLAPAPAPTQPEPVEVVALVEHDPEPEPVEVVAAARPERVPASPEVAAYAARLATLGERLAAGLGDHPTLHRLAAWPSSGLARKVEDGGTALYLWVADLHADPDALDQLDALRRGEATDAAVLT